MPSLRLSGGRDAAVLAGLGGPDGGGWTAVTVTACSHARPETLRARASLQ